MILNTNGHFADIEILRFQEAGSYAWGYNRESSDHDMLVVYRDDPVRTIFGEQKYVFNSNDPNVTYIACRLSDFIIQCTKFNLNYYCYLWSNRYVLKTSKEIESIKDWQMQYLLTKKECWYKLCVQAISCVHSYYKKNSTYKDLYRIAYMTDLALQLSASAETFKLVSPYWLPQTEVTNKVWQLHKQHLDGPLSNEHLLVFQRVYEKGASIHCPLFSLPKVTTDECVELFRGR